ncbi:MAG: cytochrome c [Proteobacteria bacterium]|nr:cytochrome c [Pseudomonadota bacterium]MBU1717047.1 cytochrome c [Pseudomonadota bacterium]
MKGRLICIVSLCAMMFSTVAFAADDAGLFLQKCGSCHKKGGQAAPVNPADKAGLVWEKYFTRDRHPVDLSVSINEDEMGTIVEYLKDHAADSDQPESATMPK